MSWDIATPASHPSSSPAAYLGQIIEEGPQPQQHRQDNHAGEEACQLEGRRDRRKKKNLTSLCVTAGLPTHSASFSLEGSLLPSPFPYSSIPFLIFCCSHLPFASTN